MLDSLKIMNIIIEHVGTRIKKKYLYKKFRIVNKYLFWGTTLVTKITGL